MPAFRSRQLTAFPSCERLTLRVTAMKLFVIGCLLCSVLLPLGTAQARTWYIKSDGTGDAPTIQAGLDSAQVGDAVILEGGTYYEHDIVLKSGVLLTSATGLADGAVIDAKHDGRVMRGRDLSGDTRIVGITLKNGWYPCVEDPWGGRPCFGGAMILGWSFVRISNCAFVDNIAAIGTGPEVGRGGGLYAEECTLVLTDCVFSGNTAHDGGGAWCGASTVSMSGCRFYDNLGECGGGLYVGGCNAQMTGCVFARNQSLTVGAGLWVGGYACTIENCTFSSNHAWMGMGAGIYSGHNGPTVSRTIIAFSTKGNAVTCSDPDDITLECCDLYGNEGGDWVGEIEGQADVSGNFSLDPRFCAEESDNLALMQCSPCAPGNHPNGWNCGLIGALSVGCPGTAGEETTWSRIKTMFR